MKAVAAKTRTQFQNILFATDFSAAAALAIPYIKNIARHYQSNVVALHVHPMVVNPVTVPGAWPTLDNEAARAIDDRHRLELLQVLSGIPTAVVFEEGDLLQSIEAAILERAIDLVVIGTHGRTGVGKLFLGSVAEQVFRAVKCPVLTVGPHADSTRTAAEGFRGILYATDLHPHSHCAAAYALSLVQEFQARLTLVHVAAEPHAGDVALWPQVSSACKELLTELVPPDAELWCRPDYFVERGDAAERIMDLARVRNADLIVLGAQPERGVTGAATHLPFATAHKVVSRATCPVLTVRNL